MSDRDPIGPGTVEGRPEGKARNGDAEACFVRKVLREAFAGTTSATCASGDEFDGEIETGVEASDPDDRRHDPAVVGAAVLLTRHLHNRRDLIREIFWNAAVVIVEVPSIDWIGPMIEAVLACFEDKHLALEECCSHRSDRADGTRARPLVVGARPDDRSASHNERKVAEAFRKYRALIGIVTPRGRGLPRDLFVACQERIVLQPFDPKSLDLVLEHVVGDFSGRRVPAEIAAAIGPADLRIALHPTRGAAGAMDRLVAVVAGRLDKIAGDGPKLDQLVGYGQAREWGLAAAADLASHGRGELPWSACEPGVLLAGPPGTGKTMFAGALARQAGVPVFAGSLAQWQSVGEAHLGTTLKAMRAFFDAARKASPCVALIDEVDSFGNRMSFDDRNRDYQTQVVNAFLECLDGMQGRPGVLIVGTTNNPKRIDPAILRAGRFDRCIVIPLPSAEELAGIIRHHLGADLASVDLVAAARRAKGGTGADCAAWVRRARSRARREGRPMLIEDLVLEIGAAVAPRSAAQDRRIAVHECGHAIVAHVLGMSVDGIVLDCAVTGGAWTEHRIRIELATGDELHDHLAACLAGRAAEILLYGSSTPGCASDLAEATDLCRDMHSRWGLGRQISVLDPKHAFGGRSRSVERDLRRAFDRAVSLLSAHRSELVRLADALVRRRVLDGRDLQALLHSTTMDAVGRTQTTESSTPIPGATVRDGSEMSHDDPK